MNAATSKKTSRRTYGGLSTEERIAERRERFIEAGLELFGTLGLRSTTVRSLCKHAGLTERYFYESFTDTEALFYAVYERETANLWDFLMKELQTLPKGLEGRVPAALNLYFNAMRDERIVRILILEPVTGGPELTASHHANIRLYADLSSHLFQSDHPDLKLSPEFAFWVAMAINGACSQLAVQWMLSGYDVPQETVVASCATLVMGTIRELRNGKR